MDIDVVVLWVDGNDPAWQAEKQKYSEKKVSDSNAVHRFRDWGLMKYWFRGIETYLPWARKIHFVTWGHLPPFLNTENPKLHIVRHQDYMPPEALPTFSSRALEMNLHRIDGLAERFVFCNDDMFINRPMKADQFFDEKTGLPKVQFCELPCVFRGYLNAWEVALARDLGLINKWLPKNQVPLKAYFGKYCNRQYPFADNIRNILMKLIFANYYTGIRVFHSPSAFLKQTFAELWEKEPALLRQTTMHRFRNTDDVNQILAFWWQIAAGKFVPGKIDGAVNDVDADTIDRLCKEITEQAHDMTCLNDPSGDIDFEQYAARLDRAFASILPDKCSFEV